MKKLLIQLIIVALFGTAFAAGDNAASDNKYIVSSPAKDAGSNTKVASDPKVILFAASRVPHADILSAMADDLKKEGFDLQIYAISEYAAANIWLEQGVVDFNFYQHAPFLTEFLKSYKYTDLVPIVKVHYEPMGVFSTKYDQTNFPEGAKIGIPDDASNLGRSLALFADQHFIKLKYHPNNAYTIADITDNPKKLQFVPIYLGDLATALTSGNVDAVTLTGRIALQNKLFKYRLFYEHLTNGFYDNVIVARKSTDPAKIRAVLKYIHSKKVYDFMINTYMGDILYPSFPAPQR